MSLKRLIAYEKRIFTFHKSEIEHINSQLFHKLFSIVTVVAFVMSILSTTNVTFDVLKIPYYLMLFVCIVLRLLFYKYQKNISIIYLFYIFYTCIFIFVTYTGYTVFPNGASTLILGFIFIYATMLYDKMIRIFLVAIGYACIYTVFAILFKSSDAIALDMVNVWGYTLVINILGLSFRLKQLENMELKAYLHQLSRTDELTKLKNRMALTDFLRDDRKTQTISSVVMMDIDYFKEYNDYYGHLTGDDCLIAITNVFLKNEEENTKMHFFRFGGEEFLLLLEDVTLELAIEKVKKIQFEISNLNIAHIHSQHHVITVSVGIAPVNASQSLYKATELADRALYRAKKDGRNCIHIST